MKYLAERISAAFARASERPFYGAAVLGGVVVLSAVSAFLGVFAGLGALAAGAYLVNPKEPIT